MFPYKKYLRLQKFPHIWCTGCGCGIVLKALLRSIEASGIPKDRIALVSGIGCSSRTPVYCDFNTLHTTHGRAIAFATGLKLVRPEMKIIVISGDGDGLAIGGNHFIHAARRNLDMTVIIYNNQIYGMTGGQPSPTTPKGMRGSTAPQGTIEPAFDISELAICAGASFVARSTCYHATQLDKLIAKALGRKGFSLIEVLSPCPTYYGRRNRLGSALELLQWYKEKSIPVEKARGMSDQAREGRITIGVLHDQEAPEFCEEYQRFIGRLRKP
jgi:2-oxoglutarate ferredoxin oxidoreductase subunit beta